jgi:tripartite-type tricarboxylate transporter receptor subunit TctC
MTTTKWRPLLSAIALGAGVTLSPLASAQDYPSRPVTMVVPFPAGGGADALARVLGREVEKRLGQPIVVENAAGAGSTIGFARVASAAPNGYTILFASSSGLVMAPHLYSNVSYKTFESFEPISMLAYSPYLLAVNAKSPYKKFSDLVQDGKANPGKLNWASPGVGTSLHLTLALILDQAGVNAQPVNYAGGAASQMGLLREEVQFLVDTPSSAGPHIKAGSTRALAVTSLQRLEEFPDVPTLDELGLKGFDSRAWFAMMAPKGTPKPVLEKLSAALKETLSSPDVIKGLKERGYITSLSTSEELTQSMRTEYDRWGKLIREKNIRVN